MSSSNPALYLTGEQTKETCISTNPFADDASITDFTEVTKLIIELVGYGFSYDAAEDAVFGTAKRMVEPNTGPDTKSDTPVI